MVNRNATSPWPFVGMAGMATAFFPYAASGFFFAPWWGALLLMLFWLVLFAICCRWFTTNPRGTVVLPVIAFAVLFGSAYVGARWLGWTI